MPDILSLAIDNLLCWVCKLAGFRDKTKGCRPICPAPYGHRSRIRADGALRHVNRSKGNIPQRQIWQRPRCAVPYIREGHSARYPLPMDSMACERGQTVGSTRRYLRGQRRHSNVCGKGTGACGDRKKPDDPIEFISMPRKGEPTRLAFIAPKVRIGTVIVPDPIEAKDKGCTLSAIRLTPKFELAFLSGSGYPPNTDVHYIVSSEEVAN